MLGNLDTDHRQCVEFARRGRCTVISVEYRLAPEHPYPAALDDAMAVLEWAAANGPELGIDASRLAVAGSSAGAALAARLAQRAAEGSAPSIVFQLLHQPVLDDRPMPSKHQSLTMFLVPLDTPGVEIQPIRTVDGDRTNITYYSDVRIDDRYRVGEVNGGWTVLREALNAEHGTVERDAEGLQKLATMTEHVLLLAEAVDNIAAIAPLDDESVKYRLGRSIAKLEAAMSTPEMFGRVAIAQTMRDISPDLMDILGAASSLPAGTDGAADDGGAEYIFRSASPTGVYGGTLEVFRNMIAQHALGLGRPNYSPPATKVS